MSIINHELAFNLDDLVMLHMQTETVCEDLHDQRDNLAKGLEQLRQEWNTPAGRYFFEQFDTDWEAEVKKFESTLNIFEEVLKDAIDEFQKVVDKADSIQLNLP